MPRPRSQGKEAVPGIDQACWILSAELFPTSHWAAPSPRSPPRGGRVGREVEIPADKAPDLHRDKALEKNPHQVAPGEQTGDGLAPHRERPACGIPAKGARAVGDRAPQSRGRELKLASTTSWPGSLLPARLAPQHPGLLLGNFQRGQGGGPHPPNPGWGSMTPHGCRPGNRVAGEEPATSNSRGRGESQPEPTNRIYTLVVRRVDKRRGGE